MGRAGPPPAGSGDETAGARGRLSLTLAPGLIGLAFGLLYSFGASTYKVGTLATPGPGLYPVFVGAIIVLSSLVYLWGEYRRPSPPHGGGSLAPSGPGGHGRRGVGVGLPWVYSRGGEGGNGR